LKTIVHTCSSILVRPNGIVRYINAVLDLQKSMGYKTIFVTDAKPTQKINADQILYYNDNSTYVPNIKDGHVWLQIDQKICDYIKYALAKLSQDPDLIVSHDLHSYMAAVTEFKDGVFVQHETDVLTSNSRYSYISDEYLDAQTNIVNTTNWRIGLSVHSDNVSPKRPVYTPAPFAAVADPKQFRTRDLLYIGDATERKGAKEFMDMARKLKVKPTVITHDPDAEVFAGADVFSFGLDERDAMYKLMSECSVAYLPSKNECPGLVVLECLQFMPVVVDSQYEWTKYLKNTGAICTTDESIEFAIEHLLQSNGNDQRNLLDIWCEHSQQYWRNLSI